MHLSRASACAIFLTLVFACAAPHALAQEPLTSVQERCSECATLAAVVAADNAAIMQLVQELELKEKAGPSYRYEAGAPTLVNKITPTDAAPHLDKAGREFASAQLGFEMRF
jgi:hypothetical protein